MQASKDLTPTRAAAADIVGMAVPLTLYEVVQTMRDDVFVRADVKPITVTWHGIRKEVGATKPSLIFIDSDGHTALGTADLFYLTEGEAMKEVAILMRDKRPSKPPVLDVNGRRFAHFDSQPVEQQAGYYREKSNGILFFDNEKEPFAFAVTNPKQGLFFVSCCRHGTSIRYMHSTCTLDEQRLGIEGMGMSAERDLVSALVEQLEGKEVGRASEDVRILELALANLAELLADPCSADRSCMGAEQADRWVDRCKAMLKSLDSNGQCEQCAQLDALRK